MSKNAKYGLLLVGIISLIILSAVALSGSQDDDKIVDNEKNTHYIGSGSIEQLDDKELFTNSETIVIGKVKETLPSKYGDKTSKDTDFGPSHVIYTDIIISVDKYLKNPLSTNEVRVRVAGGTIGDDSLTMEDEPTFKTGENVLLYLTKDTSPATQDIGPDHFVVTGLLQGKFTLTDDGKAVRPGETVSQDELLGTIKE